MIKRINNKQLKENLVKKELLKIKLNKLINLLINKGIIKKEELNSL